MTKIDVAINSYKKPESLLYTLMTLKKPVSYTHLTLPTILPSC